MSTQTTGIDQDERRSLVGILDDLMAKPGVDDETIRRAQWLRWHLTGFDPMQVLRLAFDRPSRIRAAS